ncbi:ORF140 [Lymantria xylina nucleopolyhedrovirus]|uniref:ORF140 n=1 Tax=Lymantria xylina multiple nucleopolyhedrovirus TaxID=2847840 RepID=D4N2H7_9ABAC|nr:ORF140 [Lymantria xylina nucleopolyhedrovirus]ADD73849.1 ORF140 [Lymantria xylina nucleopolyhedrovirus]
MVSERFAADARRLRRRIGRDDRLSDHTVAASAAAVSRKNDLGARLRVLRDAAQQRERPARRARGHAAASNRNIKLRAAQIQTVVFVTMSTFNKFINFVHLQGIYGMSKWYERHQWHEHNPNHVKSFFEFKLEPIICQGQDFTMTDKSYKSHIKGIIKAMNVNKKYCNPYVKTCLAAIKFIMEDNPHVDWKKVKKFFCENYTNLEAMHSLFEVCQIDICKYEMETILDALRVEYDQWQIKLRS